NATAPASPLDTAYTLNSILSCTTLTASGEYRFRCTPEGSPPSPHVMLKYSVIAPEFSPGAVRRATRPPAGPDPQTADRYQGHSDRHHHPAVPGIHGQGPRDGYRPGGGIRVHGGDPDPHQEQDAVAARPGPGGRRR